MKKAGTIAGIIMSALLALTGAFFVYELFKLGMLPKSILLMLSIIILLLWAICSLVMIKKDIHIAWKVIAWILSAAMLISCGFGAYTVQSGNKAIAEISIPEGKSGVSIYVLNNGMIHNEDELKDRKIGVLTTMNPAGTQMVLDDLNKKEISIEQVEFTSSYKMAQALKGQSIDGMILDSGYIGTLSEMPDMENIGEEIVPVISLVYEPTEAKNEAESVNTALEPFTIYISGIDTRDNVLYRNSRSDVNLIAAVNPTAHEVLLVSIPRDYYVETACAPEMGCMNGTMDKLTHTGLHGPETTEMTLEKLLGIDINYNIRVNFSSLKNVVNELGEITVNNPNNFSAQGYYFAPGEITLNGDEALAFVRERYSFSEGDRERGRNQMRVLSAIIRKALSPAILNNFNGILSSLSSSFVTNMSEQDIKELVAGQLQNGGDWKIYSYSLNGSGGTDYASELGDNAYVMYPNQATVDKGKADIQAVLNGEIPPYVNEQ